jgi:hypothetical protein
MSFRGQASRAKITSPVIKLTVLVCHLTQEINKAEEITYLFTNFGCNTQEDWTIIVQSGNHY